MIQKRPERRCFQCSRLKSLPNFKLRGYVVLTYTDGEAHQHEGWLCDECVRTLQPLLQESGGATRVS